MRAGTTIKLKSYSVIGKMVGAVGIEPATSTASR